MPVPNIAILGEVTQTMVAGLLQQRQPESLETEDVDQLARFADRVRGAAVEVVLLTGADPPAGPVRDLAVEAIALQTASEIEYAEYPEQQAQGLDGRGYHLHQRYLELLARLKEIISAVGGVPEDGGAGGIPTGSRSPLGSFPEPLREIDPEPVYTTTWWF